MNDSSNKKPVTKIKTAQEQKFEILVKTFWAVCAYLTFLAVALLISPRGYFLPKKIPPPPPLPLEEGAGITPSEIHIDKTVFGWGMYPTDLPDPEEGSTYSWLKNGEPLTGHNNANAGKVLLSHFDGSADSEEGYLGHTSGNITYSQGISGQGIVIDENDTLYYNLPDEITLDEFTIEAWFKPFWNTAEPANNHVLFDASGPTADDSLALVHWGGEKFHFHIDHIKNNGHNDQYAKWYDTWQANSWHHAALVLKNGEANFFIDGTPAIAVNELMIQTLGDKLYVGSYKNGNNQFKGVIDELRVSNIARTPDEIQERADSPLYFKDQEQYLEIDPAIFQAGDTIQFFYTPCYNNGSNCGNTLYSQELEVQSFQSSLTINADIVERVLNRDLLGYELKYDEGPVTHEVGPNAGAGQHTWDEMEDGSCPQDPDGCPNPETVLNAQNFKLGTSRLWDYNKHDDDVQKTVEEAKLQTDRMMEFAQAANIQSYQVSGIAPFVWRMGHPHPQWSIAEMEEFVDYFNNEQNYNIRYWEIGNEPYGAGIPGNETAQVANEYGQAMKAVDDSVRITIPLADNTIDDALPVIDPDYVDDVQTHAYLSHGNLSQEDKINPSDEFISEELFPDIVGASPERTKQRFDWTDNRIAVRNPDFYNDMLYHMTEYNVHQLGAPDPESYTYPIHLTSETLTGAIGGAVFRNLVLTGGIIDTASFYAFGYGHGAFAYANADNHPTVQGHVAEIYADHVRDNIVRTDIDTVTFDAPGDRGQLEPHHNIPALDVLSTLSSDGQTLSVIVVNRDGSRDLSTTVDLANFLPDAQAQRAYLNVDPQAHPEHGNGDPGSPQYLLESRTHGPFHLWNPEYGGQNSNRWYWDEDDESHNGMPAVPLIEDTYNGASESFFYEFPAHSITALTFTRSQSQQTLDIELSSDDTTLKPGETLIATAEVTNLTNNYQTFQAWGDITLPNGEPYWGNPVFGPQNFNLDPYQTVPLPIILDIPPDTPEDSYILTGAVGDYPASVIDSDPLPFTVSSGGPRVKTEPVPLPAPTPYWKEPLPPGENYVRASYTTTPPTIDGEIDEWLEVEPNKIPYTNAVRNPENIEGPEDSQAIFGAMWDENNLYVAVRARDEALINDSSPIWWDDSTELYLDGLHDGEQDSGYNSDDHQYTVDLANEHGGVNSEGYPIATAVSQQDGFYRIEYQIPFTHLQITPAINTIIGFDLGVNDDDDGGERDSQIMWYGDGENYRDTSVFGDLKLVE